MQEKQRKNELFGAFPLLTGMKIIQKVCLSLLIVTGAGTGVAGEAFRTDINPALLYYQAFILAPDLSQADRDYLFNTEWRGQKLPERFGELVARYDNEFKLVRQAAQATVPCDWGIDMSPGPATLLPQLARNKVVMQAARLRTMWNLQQGNAVRARDDLLAALALGRNSSHDGTLIAVLVQIAMENILCCTLAENFHKFSAETLKQLADGFDAAPARGTVVSCIPKEKTFFRDWLVAKVQELQKENEGNDARTMAAIHELIASLSEKVAKAAGGTSEGVLKLLREEDPVYERLAIILALPQPEYEDQMKQFNAEIQNSSNPFISQSFSAWGKCRSREFAVLVEQAIVQAAVEYKLHGEQGLKSITDPCGQGPFAFQRFAFEGMDRGFELRSAYDGRGFPEVLIFVEKDGPPFQVNWKNAGEALPKSSAPK